MIPANPTGPYDISEIADDDPIGRVDLGALHIPFVEGMELNFEQEPTDNPEEVMLYGVQILLGESALSLRAYAASRVGDAWEESRKLIIAELTLNPRNTVIELDDGPAGPEVKTAMVGPNGDGGEGEQTLRLIGGTGPRWLLHGVMLGEASLNDEAAGPLYDLFKLVAVNRGPQPMNPGSPLALALPDVEEDEDDEVSE